MMATTEQPHSDCKVTPSEPGWIDVLQNTKVCDVIPQGRPLVKVSYIEYVSDLLKRMSEAKVLSAVVVDPDPKIGVIGFVDVLDVLNFVIQVTEQSGKDITKESIQNLKWEGKCFSLGSSGSLVNISRADPLCKISSQASLWEAIQLMAKEVHRLAVIDEHTHKNHIANVISQSDIVHFIATRGIWVGTKMSKSIVSTGLAPMGAATVQADVNVVATLRYMRDYRVGGVGVVDKVGRLIANFSATDLVGLTADNFYLLALSVKEFLERMHGYPKPPVFVTPTDTVENVVYKMCVHAVHRVYIVDSMFVPTGVISMTDIMMWLFAG